MFLGHVTAILLQFLADLQQRTLIGIIDSLMTTAKVLKLGPLLLMPWLITIMTYDGNSGLHYGQGVGTS